MKKMVALFVVFALMVCTIPLTFAGGAGWHRAQSKRNAAYKKWLKQEAEFWKKFDAEMAEAGNEDESEGPVKKRKQR